MMRSLSSGRIRAARWCHLCDPASPARADTEHERPAYCSPTLNGGSLPGGVVSSAIASIMATMT